MGSHRFLPFHFEKLPPDEMLQRARCYYELMNRRRSVQESVGMACGFFITALHYMGLHTLTHTPSPMGFLSEILKRPENERPYILFPVGYPASEAVVPDVKRKSLDEVSEWL